MEGKLGKKALLCVNLLFGALTCGVLYTFIRTAITEGIRFDVSFGALCGIVVQIAAINLIKSFRLYLILIEGQMRFVSYLSMYAETALVNMILPYKSGEIYRGLRAGQATVSILWGYIVVLLDRFLDTLALISIIMLLSLFYEIPVSPMIAMLFTFCFVLILIYCLFPQLYRYLNHFFIFYKNSEGTLKALHALHLCNKMYEEVGRMVRGRFLLLYLLSGLAWFVEIAGLLLEKEPGGVKVMDYLTNAMLSTPSGENVAFIMVSAVMFVLVSVSVRLITFIRGTHDEYTHSL